MKKIIIVLLICVMCLTACSEDENYITNDEKIQNFGQELYEGYKDRDVERIISVLSENLKDKSSIDKKIEESFEYIDGNIVGYEDIRGSIGGGKIEKGEEVLYGGLGSVINVKTDKDKKYCICYKVNLIDKKDEGNLDVVYLYIIDESTDEIVFEIGE